MKINEIASNKLEEQTGDWRTDPAARRAKEREQALQADPISQMFTPGASSAEDVADIAQGDYGAIPYAALGLAPGVGGPVSKFFKKIFKRKPDVSRAQRAADKELEKSRKEALKQKEKEAAKQGKEVETGLVDPSGKPITRPAAKGEQLPGETPAVAKPGWVKRAGKWVVDNPKKTLAGLGTGYYLTPSAITDPVKDFVVGKGKEAVNVSLDAAEQGLRTTGQELEKERQAIEKKKKEQAIDVPPAEKEIPGELPLDRERRLQGWPQSKVDTTTSAAEKALTEKYLKFLDEKETPAYTKEQYLGWAKKYADQYEVPLPMVLHAMYKETGWLGDPERMRTATSPTGARGVMQIQPQYAEKGAYKIKVKDLTDPEKNIEAGVRGLAYYLNKHKTPEKALAAYNAGEGGAANFLKTGEIKFLPKETKKYIQGYKDDVIHQLEKFFPKDKQKVAQVATDVLAVAVGAKNAQAANEIPAAPVTASPKVAVKAAVNKDKPRDEWLSDFDRRQAELEKEAKKRRDQLQADQEVLDRLSGGKDRKSDKKDKPAEKKPEDKKPSPKARTYTTTDTQGKTTTYTQNKKGQWVAPNGDIMPMPEKPKAAEPKPEEKKGKQSVSGVIEPPPVSDIYPDELKRGIKARADAPKADKKQNVAPVADVAPDKAPAAEVPKADVRKDFERAFAAARAKQVLDTGKGSGGTFTWTNPVTGKAGTYTTDYADEIKAPAKKKAQVPPVSDIYPDEIVRGVKPSADAKPSWRDQDLERITNQVPDSGRDNDEDDIEKIIKSKQSKSSTVEKPANVLRSADGTPVISGTGEPWSTGTSTEVDINRAKSELQQKIDNERNKKELEKISPDLSVPDSGNSFVNKWSQGIEALTGKKILDPKEMDKIRVPESVNTELDDLLWLAGRKNK